MGIPINILLLDFSSENNRGDAAMQVGLLELVFRHFKDPVVTIISVFGANQADQLLNEYDHSLKFPVKILGGLKPTFYPINNNSSKPIFFVELKQAIYFILNILMIILIFLKVPTKIIKKVLPKEFRITFEQIERADLVIWKGKNFRIRSCAIVDLYRIVVQIFHPVVCIALSKPIACVSASVWHLKNPLSRILLRGVFRNCFFLSLREEASYDEAIELIGDVENPKVVLLPDLSFVVFDHAKDIKANRVPFPTSTHPKTIGLTIVDWKNEGDVARENYKEVIISVIDYYVKAGSNIVIIPQVTKQWEAFDLLLSEVMETGRDMKNISIIKGNPTIFELFSIYSNIDILIATRMHSAIFSAFVGTPLVVIPYDKGGKWNIIKDLGYDSQSISYSTVSTKAIIYAIDNCWNNKDEILRLVNERVKQSASSVEHNISMLIEFSPFKERINNRYYP